MLYAQQLLACLHFLCGCCMQPCGIHKHTRIFLIRRMYYPLRFAFLNYASFMKYAYSVTERGNKAHIVSDKENRNAQRFLQLLEQL